MLEPGQLIDVWVVEKPIGSGGMGSVYRCHNKHSTRILAALKTLDPVVRKIPEAEARFVREAEILFSLDHPNVVKVRNLRLDADPPYLEMEFVEGESLESRLCRGPLPLEQALDMTGQLLEALVYLHDKGIRHRDIKPANLLINKEGRLKLVDFGLATEADVSRITRANTTFGTVSYAPPEWIRPDELDPESWDLYATGVVFWEMLTARVAFPGSPNIDPRQQAVMIMSVKQSHPPLDPGPFYRDDLRALCGELTHPDRAQRSKSARDALQRLKALDRSPSQLGLPAPQSDFGQPRPPSIADVALTQLGPEGAAKQRAAPRPAVNRSPTPVAGAPVQRQPTGQGLVVLSGLAGAGAGLAILVVVAAIALFVMWKTSPQGPSTPPPRPVDVVVTGLPKGTAVGLAVGAATPTSVDGFTYHFGAVPVGKAPVAWAVGDDCAVPGCPGASCPAWCAVGQAEKDVEAGDGVQTISLELQPPAPRVLHVVWRGATSPKFALGSRTDATPADDGARFDGVVPNAYRLTAEDGTCPPEAAGCAVGGTCPPGCVSWAGEVVVASGDGEATFEIPVAPPPAPATSTPSTSVPSTSAVISSTEPATPKSRSHVVTKGEFQRWLDKTPDWQKDAAVADGRADQNYLKSWNGGAPSSAAAVYVSWAAAQAYCAAHGGLAPVDAAPHDWPDDEGAVFMEWRIDGGQPAWRRQDGATSKQVVPSHTDFGTGFRCAR